MTTTCIPAALLSGLKVTKSTLAKVLDVSTRTVQNYVAAGVLPQPVIEGRTAVWAVESLTQAVADALVEGGIPPSSLAQLQAHLESLLKSGPIPSPMTKRGMKHIATGYLVDEQAVIDVDWRPRIYEMNAESRAAAREFHGEALQQQRGSEEAQRLFDLARRNREAVDVNELRLSSEFVPAHGASQLVGARDLSNHAVFTARMPQLPREAERDATFKLPDGTTMRYQGPELRQDDALMFSALIRIASDARPGRLVGFSPKDVCLALYDDYCGHRRTQLKATIARLQSAKLTFSDYAVQLVGRFEFPKRGLWRVALDTDVVRLFTGGRDVRLNLDKALDYGDGLVGWLYRYVCSQTSLIPTKVEHLRKLAGSSGSMDYFRGSLRKALAKLAAGGDIHAGWSIDKHDMVRWMKVRPAEARVEAQGASEVIL